MTTPPKRPVVFYGVNSEGMGHATRARPVLEALGQRYEVHVFCGGRTRNFLRKHFPHVHSVWYVRLRYKDNRVNVKRTVFWSFLEGPWALLTGGFVTLLALLKRPVAIITDYECLSAWAGMLTFTKVITLDNQMLIEHGDLPDLGPEHQASARVVSRVTAFNTPVVHHSLISSFWQPGLRTGVDPRRARFVPVAVREVVRAKMKHTSTSGPVLVYQTSTTNVDLPDTLVAAAARTGLRFAVYGMNRTGTLAGGNVEFRAFSEEGFVQDLAAAPFVIINGGHSTICEALALRKPVLAEPVQDQFEQSVNVTGLEALGIGRGTRKLGVEDVVAFEAQVPLMRKRMEKLAHLVDTEGLNRAVEEALYAANPKRALPPRPALVAPVAAQTAAAAQVS